MQYNKVSELKKLPNNPRVIKDKQFRTLCESIRNLPQYFEARPLLLSNRTGELVIIAGNQRYEAAVNPVEGYEPLTEVPTHLILNLTEEQEKEIILRDNVSNGEWDFEILEAEFSDLPLVDWGVISDTIGKMAKSFEKIQEEFDLSKMKIPITIVVNKQGWEEWERVKTKLGITDDLKAFNKLLKEVSHD